MMRPDCTLGGVHELLPDRLVVLAHEPDGYLGCQSAAALPAEDAAAQVADADSGAVPDDAGSAQGCLGKSAQGPQLADAINTSFYSNKSALAPWFSTAPFF